MSRRQFYVKRKNIDTGNAVFISACVIFALFVFFVIKGEAVEKTNVVATIIIALVALRIQHLASRKEKTQRRRDEILNSCKLINDSFLDTKKPDDKGNVVYSRVDENGIMVMNQEKSYVYYEVDFNSKKSTKECTLYVTIRNLKGNDWRDYYEPFKCIHYISTASTNALEILNMRGTSEYVEETEGYLSIEPLSIGKIGNYEWDEIKSVLANILTTYAMEKENLE